MCGNTIFVKYAFSNDALARCMDIHCITTRLCYTFHRNRTPHQEPRGTFKKRVRNCVVKFSIVAGRWNKHLLRNNSVESFINDVDRCIPDSMIPEDVGLITAAMRYGRKFL
ncbi:uncharacterized protein LOC135366048 [Ornithodoros turicata]|uniref:uncharacterized protein LOC135366048 n=1 Tax=Ornithodoros turicata TaxID=34597 RepID=UPI003139938C